MSKETTAVTIFPTLSILGIIFVTLKLLGYISWSWWYVTLPFYGPFVLFFALLAVAGLFVLLGKVL